MGEFETLAIALEYNDSLPSIDLHGLSNKGDIETKVRALVKQNAKNPHAPAVRIIYGRGGVGLIKKVVHEVLGSYPNVIIHEEDRTKKGSCLAIFKNK